LRGFLEGSILVVSEECFHFKEGWGGDVDGGVRNWLSAQFAEQIWSSHNSILLTVIMSVDKSHFKRPDWAGYFESQYEVYFGSRPHRKGATSRLP
jgi:hypothetical protein